jgi:predicted ATPase
MEYVEGRTLRDLLAELGRIPEWFARDIAVQVASGLEAVHDHGIIHRDLKPANLVITPDEAVKIMDLGLARSEEGLQITSTGQFVGSVPYAAPEQFQADREPLDARTDLYALGVVLFELLTGRLPFEDPDVLRIIDRIRKEEAPRLSQLDSTVSPFFDEVVRRLLAKRRADRFQSAAELLQALRSAGPLPPQAKSGATPAPLARRPRISRESAVYGREEEIERLEQSYERAASGAGQVVLVEGSAGVGKSRLVDEFVARMERDHGETTFLFGSYPPGGAATALEAFSRAFRDHLVEEGLESALRRRLGSAPALSRPFAAMLKGEPAPPGSERLPRDSLQTAFTHVLRSLASERPTVLVIDDLQFAPRDGLSLFAALAHAVPEHRVLLIGCTRRGLLDAWQGELEFLDHVTNLPLDRLPPDAVEAIIAETLGSEALTARLGPLVVAKTDGNPLFVFEILRDLKERRALEADEDGAWRARAGISEIRIPSSVTRLLETRLSDLEEEDRNLLEVAACAGYRFDPFLLGETVELTRIPLLRKLVRIERNQGLVRAVGRVFVFDHQLVRETLYNGMAEALRQTYHAALATTLERRIGDSTPEAAVAVQICEHHLKAEQADLARPHLGPAVEHLVGAYHNEQALALIEGALQVPGLIEGAERIELLLRAADLHELTGQHEDMSRVLHEARALADSLGDDALRPRVRTRLGGLLYGLGEYESACKALEEALDLARDAGNEVEEGGARAQLGACLAELGRLEEARDQYRTCLDLARSTGDRRAVAVAMGNLGQIATERGEIEDARGHLEESLTVFRELGDRTGVARASGALGNLLHDLGRFEEAVERHRTHLEISREIGYRRGEEIALYNLGEALRKLGRLEEARRHFEREGQISAEIGDRLGVATSLASLGSIEWQMGLDEQARKTIERALSMSRELGSRWVEGRSLLELGALLEQVGEFGPAVARVEEALAVFRELGEASLVGESLVALGRLLIRQDRSEETRPLFEEALAIGRERGFPPPLVLGACYLAMLGEVDVEEARELLDEFLLSLDIRQRLEAFFTLWKAKGEPADLRSSHELLSEIERAAADDAQGDARRTSSGLHREVGDAWRDHTAS